MKLFHKRYHLLIGILCLIGNVLAQSEASYYFEDQYFKGDDHIYFEEYDRALPIFKELNKLPDGNNSNIAYKLGICYLHSADKTKAIEYLEKACQNTSLKYSGESTEENAPVYALFVLGQAYHANSQIDKALETYNKYKEFLTQKNKDLLKITEEHMNYCFNARKYMEFPNDIQVKNLGLEINTKYAEYSPVISSDVKTLIFTSRRKGSTGGMLDEKMMYYEDIFISRKNESGVWQAPEKISHNINTSGHEACLSLSKDGTKLLIFKSEDSDGNIFQSTLENDKWTTPVELDKPINSSKNESHACLSPDGKTIYFTSNRGGGFGGNDIYSSTLQSDGKWSKPTNLGEGINTVKNEEAPFMTYDGKTLYFSSQGHESMGGYDIYKSNLSTDGFWSTPVNLGYPINSTGDDVFYFPSADNRVAYYSSEQPEGFGGQDIYQINIIKEQEMFAMLKGKIADPISFKPVNAKIEIKDARNDETVALVHASDTTGSYHVSLPANKQYKMSVSAEGHEDYTESFFVDESQKGKDINKSLNLAPTGTAETTTSPSLTSAKSIPEQPVDEHKAEIGATPAPDKGTTPAVTQDLPKKQSMVSETASSKTTSTPSLQESDYAVNETFVMNNIYFDYGKASLKTESISELTRLLDFLKKLPSIKVEISGHTDNTSSDKFNKKLSEKRAKSVVDFLTNSGIAASRLTYKGYGFDKPIATNTTTEGQQLNRRVEVKIVDIGGKIISQSQARKNNTATGNSPSKDDKGDIFKVQFTTSIKALPSGNFAGLEDVSYYKHANLYKYTVGNASSRRDLRELEATVKQLGYTDAFIVKFIDGEREFVPLQEDLPNAKYVYKVKISSLAQHKPLDSPDFKGVENIEMFRQGDKFCYAVGKESTRAAAETLLADMRSKGFDDAYIITVEKSGLPTTATRETTQIKKTTPVKPANTGSAEAKPKEIPKKGLVFRVQIATSTYAKSVTSDEFKDISGLSMYQHDNKYCYTIGNASTIKEADETLSRAISLGFQDAFIIAFNNGVRIPLGDAIKMLNK